ATDRLVDDRGDVDDQEGLFRHAENDAAAGGSTSREFRRAQNDGYLRTSSSERTASVREGLGQFGAAPDDTQRLDEFNDTESDA
uniref:hypothetical protein n=1 Tax=Halostella sp. PRR32 TaxID=3098147 RepID=UPI002B1D0EF4